MKTVRYIIFFTFNNKVEENTIRVVHNFFYFCLINKSFLILFKNLVHIQI